MINIVYGSEQLHDIVEPHIDKLLNADIYIYLTEGSDNIIYNSITDSVTGTVCYPDMLIKHNLTECQICDNTLYTIADDAIRRYGSSRCFFLSLKDINIIFDFIKKLREIFTNNQVVLHTKDIELVEKFGNELMLSATMMHSFKNLMTYYATTGGDVHGLLMPFEEEYPLPVTTKQKGKQIYELIRNKILS